MTNVYNQKKTQSLAKIGMYITYCIAIDKIYIPTDMTENFMPYFDWCKQEPSIYVPLDKFQEYLDNAERVTLVSHSTYLLSKYFNIHTQEEREDCGPEDYHNDYNFRASNGGSFY